jgi:hypothetical protein
MHIITLLDATAVAVAKEGLSCFEHPKAHYNV